MNSKKLRQALSKWQSEYASKILRQLLFFSATKFHALLQSSFLCPPDNYNKFQCFEYQKKIGGCGCTRLIYIYFVHSYIHVYVCVSVSMYTEDNASVKLWYNAEKEAFILYGYFFKHNIYFLTNSPQLPCSSFYDKISSHQLNIVY